MIAGRLARQLHADGYAVRTCVEPPKSLENDAFDRDARAAIVIGGDGTIRAVAERYLELHGQSPPLLPIPLGTANLMVRHLKNKLPDRELEASVSTAIRRLQLSWLDAGRANGQLFFLMAGIGYDCAGGA